MVLLSKLRAGVAVIVALVIGIIGVYSGYEAVASALPLSLGSGGLGAVSLGVSEALAQLLPGILVNLLLSAWARQSGGAIRMLHRIQSWALILMFVAVPVVAVALWQSTQDMGKVVFGGLMFGGLLYGGQMMLAGALLGAYAVRTFRTPGSV